MATHGEAKWGPKNQKQDHFKHQMQLVMHPAHPACLSGVLAHLPYDTLFGQGSMDWRGMNRN